MRGNPSADNELAVGFPQPLVRQHMMPSLPPLNVICRLFWKLKYTRGKDGHSALVFYDDCAREDIPIVILSLLTHSLTQIGWEREREAAIAPSSHQHFQNRLTVRAASSFLPLSSPFRKHNVPSRAAQIDN